MKLRQLPQSKKLRIILNQISIYTTVRAIREGMFGDIRQNAAAQKALCALEYIRSGKGQADQCATGLAGTWENYQVQVDIL